MDRLEKVIKTANKKGYEIAINYITNKGWTITIWPPVGAKEQLDSASSIKDSIETLARRVGL